jgi:hypothetical protein
MGKVLRAAKDKGEPYHVVHFDGHGTVLEVEKLFQEFEGKTDKELAKLLETFMHFDPNRFSPEVVYPRPRRAGSRGYLAFENPGSAHNLRLVDGPELGALLVETKVPVLVLNACRSAHAEAPPVAEPADSATSESAAGAAPASAPNNPHSHVRAFGSFAQEVMDAGAAGVIAMRYNVYVVTAARFVAELYGTLTQGYTLGEAVTLGRKQLHADPLREIAFQPRPLQDWAVPVVYEAGPLSLFPARSNVSDLKVTLGGAQAMPAAGNLDPGLPKAPDAGFFGRDETLLALDRAFDQHHVVLLHAYAGSGKTATAAEFARWYALTGGLHGGEVLFTTFEHHTPLPRVLDRIGQQFGRSLEQSGINWLALNDVQRRDIAIQVLTQVPVLWVWDNVEPVAGFPPGTESAWNAADQRELLDFLSDARDTKVKILLTSLRDEGGWV